MVACIFSFSSFCCGDYFFCLVWGFRLSLLLFASHSGLCCASPRTAVSFGSSVQQPQPSSLALLLFSARTMTRSATESFLFSLRLLLLYLSSLQFCFFFFCVGLATSRPLNLDELPETNVRRKNAQKCSVAGCASQ